MFNQVKNFAFEGSIIRIAPTENPQEFYYQMKKGVDTFFPCFRIPNNLAPFEISRELFNPTFETLTKEDVKQYYNSFKLNYLVNAYHNL